MFGFGKESYYNRPIPDRFTHGHESERAQQHQGEDLLQNEAYYPRPLEFGRLVHNPVYQSESQRFHPLPISIAPLYRRAVEMPTGGVNANAVQSRGVCGTTQSGSPVKDGREDKALPCADRAVTSAFVTAEILRLEQTERRAKRENEIAFHALQEQQRRAEHRRKVDAVVEKEKAQRAAKAGTNRSNAYGWAGVHDCHYLFPEDDATLELDTEDTKTITQERAPLGGRVAKECDVSSASSVSECKSVSLELPLSSSSSVDVSRVQSAPLKSLTQRQMCRSSDKNSAASPRQNSAFPQSSQKKTLPRSFVMVRDNAALPGIDPITHQPRTKAARYTQQVVQECNHYSYLVRQNRLHNKQNPAGYNIITGETLAGITVPSRPVWL